MTPIDENRISAIIKQVKSEIGPKVAPTPIVGKSLRMGDGIFGDVDSAVAAAAQAQREFAAMPLDLRYDIVEAMRRAGREHALVLAQMAHEETGMGRVEDKVEKNLLNANKTPGPEYLTTEAWSGDHGLTITEFAPYGVIASITPSTNPTSSIINNSISMISAGNSVVFNAHPGAKACSAYTIQVLNRAIQSVGGPPNLLTATAEPTIQSAQALMRHKGVRLLSVTGGGGVVREAMRSGKRAVCAGPGNPPAVVDETADIEQAARDIVRGASFDNNIICVDEKTTIVVESVADALVEAMTEYGAYLITGWQLRRLMKSIITEDRGPGKPAAMNHDFIGKNASVLLREIGIKVGDEVRLVIAVVEPDHQLVWSEQMMPVMPIVPVPDVDTAIDLARASEHGFRHTASMHSKHLDHLSKMARVMDCSIFVKNGPNFSGVGHGGEGYCSFTIASPTGEGLTTCRSFSRLRRCVLKDSFRIV